ncbi:T9SS type A sorting domain-containing protein [Tamlana fucoidanivorans]|uniref:T9SS type A sorting domain-containing protein n=1 Tax=Allotamlana fucoidanivorans TaxID=2583814 RepID=A0A5C4SMR8_9FLAO|nr:LamG-like jellyroll fold domain-containing protein [Tamlana fucoidanivorans]TNJ45383.1 T9SS type A sorting domain-containing protein [Tamlana fucoidanivorans]
MKTHAPALGLRFFNLCFFVLCCSVSLYAQYCTPINVDHANNNYISNVSIGSINNSSSGTTGSYTYYSSVTSADINAGETITGTVTVKLNGWNKNKNTLIVWMNFNNSDSDFEDSRERFLFTVEDKSKEDGEKTVVVPVEITIPDDVELGASVMRIGFRTGQNNNFTSCDYQYQSGEIEDYNISFVASQNSNIGFNNGNSALNGSLVTDSDGDGIADITDLDDDNDGIKDTDESGGIDPSADDDGDGVLNYKDSDFCSLGASGICEDLDQDGDGIPNHLDLDSDNDGITDVIESGGTDADYNGFADGTIGITATTMGIPSSANTGTVPRNTDGDSNESGSRYLIYDFLDIDSDEDGIPDNVEAQSTLGYIAPSGGVSTTGIDTSYGLGIVVEDTDYDGIPDYIDLDSDNDGKPDEAENGLATPSTNQDKDADGLINPFETTNINDTVWDVNEAIENPSDLSILPDGDNDLNTGGDLDYRDVFDTNPPILATIDFDGVDDFMASDLNIGGNNQTTIMAWVKLDENFSNAGTVVSFGDLNITVQSSKQVSFQVNGVTLNMPVSNSLVLNQWAHIGFVYNGLDASSKLQVYLNGELLNSSNNAALSGGINASSNDFTIGVNAPSMSYYFKGSIDEVRVFDVALTDDQLQQMVYQEIENNLGKIQGKIIPKDITDRETDATVSWSSLIGYYPMTEIINAKTSDYSDNDFEAILYNITTVQDQSAPMPYETIMQGDWNNNTTWLYGDLWDITNTVTNKAWSIVKIANNVTAAHNVQTLGLVIDDAKTLTIQGDNLVENTWYLELNGALDLEDDSQLIQTIYSDLVTDNDGKVLRRQEGEASPFRYNYWASPVGAVGITSLTNNNAALNNANNSSFKLNTLKDDVGLNMPFTSSYTGNGSISTYWLYTFISGITYWDWKKVAPSSLIKPGIGYTQKGTGTAAPKQQYIFEGKPNNGTVLLDVTDKGGAGSVPDVSKTEYLIGNPYPSAIDIHKFIDDNQGVIKGDLHLWQQWSGNSHYLSEYQGGYAQVNKTGACRAYQFVGLSGGHNGSQDGTKVPTRYLPVGQGFVVEVEADGQIEFNNNQRIFIKEADANSSYDSGSVFLKSSGTKSNGKTLKSSGMAKEDSEKIMQRIRLEFNTVKGPKTRRELLLGFAHDATDGFDYGYDAECLEINNNDMNLSLEGKNMNIQAYSPISDDKVIPLNFKSSGDNTFEIKMTSVEGIPDDQEIFLKDNVTGDYFNLISGEPYGFSSDQGKFNTRFEIVFQSEQHSLSIEESEAKNNFIYFKNKTNTLFVKKMNGNKIRNLQLVNMRGQVALQMPNLPVEALENGFQFYNLSSGAYIVQIRTENNEVLSKKIIVN